MNINSNQAYINLIEVLLNCPSGEELTILESNQNLINAELVQIMLDYAVNLAVKNSINASERLISTVINLLITLRNAGSDSQEFFKAIDYYERFLVICQERNYQQMQIMLTYYISFFYRNIQDYAKAIESSKQLLAIVRNHKQDFLEAETLFHLGIDYQSLSNLDEARNYYKQSLAIAEQINDFAAKKLQIDILNTLGASYNPPYAWDLGKAIEICTSSMGIAKEIGYRYGEAVALTCIGKAHYWAPGEYRNFPAAIRCYEQAKSIFQEIGNLQGELDALQDLQDSYNYTSQYAQAIECNNQLLSIGRDLKNSLIEASALFNLGRSYDALGYLQKDIARNYYEQSLAIANKINHPNAYWLQIHALQGLGGYYIINGELTAASENYQKSLKIAENIREEQGQANALQALANIDYYQGNLKQAWDYNERSLMLKEKLQDQIGKGASIGFRGSICLLTGEYTKALESFEQSLQIMEELKNVAGKASILTDMGVAYLGLNQIEEAENRLRAGIKLWESVRGSLGEHDDFKVSIFEQQANTYDLLQAVLIDQKKPLLALEIAESSRARAFVDLLSKKLNGQLDKTTITSPTIKEIRQIAQQHNATLVEYSVNKSELYIWVIKPNGEIVFKQMNLKSLNISLGTSKNIILPECGMERSCREDVLSGKLQSILARSEGELETSPHKKILDIFLFESPLQELVSISRNAIGVRSRESIPIARAPNKDEKQYLQKLYNLLIKPIADQLPSDPNAHIIFIPHKELFLVPFAALKNEQGKYLIEEHTVLTAPSIQVLDLTRKKLEQRLSQNSIASQILIVGNPTMPSVSLNIGVPATKLSPLPGAEKEALEIATLFNTKAFIGAEATETAIKSKLLHADIIHFATHGLLDYGQIPGQRQDLPGALALAPEVGKEDGLLTSSEIFDLQLNASLIVLSACDTGKGEITSDGILGLSRSFISAGTPSIIVSLWAVDDDCTADLMKEFYCQLKLNFNKAQALRQAMLKTMERHPHPKYWAAFTLIGQTEGTVLNAKKT